MISCALLQYQWISNDTDLGAWVCVCVSMFAPKHAKYYYPNDVHLKYQ